MSILHAPPAARQSLGGIPTPRTFDPSTGQPMPDYSEPTFPSGGVPDELAPAYRDSRRNSYSAAHAEADAADMLDELDTLRCDLAARDYTAAEFAAVLHDQAPGVLYSVTATQYVATSVDPATGEAGVTITEKYEGWVSFPGARTRHIEGVQSLRELAERIVCEHKARSGMGRPLAVVEVAAG